MGRIIDLFGGPGGWDEALAELGRSADVLGIEWDEAACATRTAAGHATRRADVSTVDHREYADLEGLIASPPCQGFSSAGNGAARDMIPELLASIHARRWTDRADEDPRVWLIVDLGRWLTDLDPEWIALEQVPSVLPIWRAYADLLRERGYSTWTGILNAADYGVPQTRTRAILMAHRTRLVHPPEATHDRDPVDSLFGTLERWVTMAEALPDMAGRFAEYRRGGDRIHEGFDADTSPADTLTTRADRWQIGFPRLDDRGDSPDGYSERDWRDQDEPAFVVTEKARSWVIRGGQWQLQANARPNATVRDETEPAPTLAIGHASNDWVFTRPATTIQGDPRCWPPGHKVNADDRNRLGDNEANERYGDRAGTDAIRLTITDALVLQSFRPDYPVAGTKTKAFEQIGNAIPPRLARHVLEALNVKR